VGTIGESLTDQARGPGEPIRAEPMSAEHDAKQGEGGGQPPAGPAGK
jgi:hypothetical protein